MSSTSLPTPVRSLLDGKTSARADFYSYLGRVDSINNPPEWCEIICHNDVLLIDLKDQRVKAIGEDGTEYNFEDIHPDVASELSAHLLHYKKLDSRLRNPKQA